MKPWFELHPHHEPCQLPRFGFTSFGGGRTRRTQDLRDRTMARRICARTARRAVDASAGRARAATGGISAQYLRLDPIVANIVHEDRTIDLEIDELRVARAVRMRASVANSLGDAYILGDLLGRGGMGSVYAAEQRSLGRSVAVKLMHPEFSTRSGSFSTSSSPVQRHLRVVRRWRFFSVSSMTRLSRQHCVVLTAVSPRRSIMS